MSIDARLEHNLSLTDLVNTESLGNLCEQFRLLSQCPLQVTNLDGTPLQGTPVWACACTDAASCPVCGSVARSSEPRFSDDEKVASITCRSGRSYLRARVDNQFEPVGFITMGPLVGNGRASATTPSPALSRQLLQFLCTVLEEIVFANYQSYLVSKMNLQSYAENLGELLDKDGELQKYEETLKESKELRSLF